jgi:hypothetical protein
MVLWLLYIFTTTTFGSMIVLYIRKYMWATLLHTFIGWLIGAMTTSILLYFTSMLLPINIGNVIVIIIIQCSITALLFMLLKKDKIKRPNNKLLPFRFEASPAIYLVVLIIGSITLWYNRKIYCDFPENVTVVGMGSIDYEMSFIASLRFGINAPRSNILVFTDPLLLNQHITGNPLPVLFEASICALGVSYRTASTIISFMNSIATAISIFYLASNFSSNPTFVALVYMLNGSWCIFNFFDCNEVRHDLIHGFGRTAHTPWDSLIGVCLSFNKEHSFTIPMALFALAIAQCPIIGKAKNSYLIATILACMIPNFITSLAVFLSCTCYELANPFFVGFAFIPFLRFLGNKISYNPLWREYQMCNTFLPSIMIWLDGFGISSVTFVLMWFFIRDHVLIQRFMSTFASFLILTIFRQGNDYSNNTCAIISVFFPMVCVLFVECGQKIKCIINGKMARGALAGFVSSFFIVYMISGFMSLYRITQEQIPAIEAADYEIGENIRLNTERKDTVLSETFYFNPASAIAGRQIVSGSFKEAWRRGCDVFKQVEMIREIQKESGGLEVMKSQDIKYLLDLKEDVIIWDSSVLKHFQTKEENPKWILYQLQEV